MHVFIDNGVDGFMCICYVYIYVCMYVCMYVKHVLI
jgi:hypothetical protein